MEWIKIEDRLPSKNGIYIVIRKWSDEYNAASYQEFTGGSWNDKLEEIAGQITHWRENGGAKHNMNIGQNFTELLQDAQELLLDQPTEVQDLIYWACSLDDEARAALIWAYQTNNQEI